MYEHFKRIELPITINEFYRLPRNAAYKYEYFGGRAVLTPRPKTFNCVRETDPIEASGTYLMEPVTATEIPTLEDLFLQSTLWTEPFHSLDEPTRRLAARDCLDRVVTGKEGPLVEGACFRAVNPEKSGQSVGAALVTLANPYILTVPFEGAWRGSTSDAVKKQFGIPHLTWIFVDPFLVRRGVATTLLAAVLRALHAMGYPQLSSTFLLDNAPSALWHWRNGFRLLPQMSAMRPRTAEGIEQDDS